MHIKQTLACRELGISEKVTMVSHLSSLIPKVCQVIQLSKVPVCAPQLSASWHCTLLVHGTAGHIT